MKLVLGLVLAGITISALPPSAKACWVCNPIEGTKATIRKPHRAVQAVTDGAGKVVTAGAVVFGTVVGGHITRGTTLPDPNLNDPYERDVDAETYDDSRYFRKPSYSSRSSYSGMSSYFRNRFRSRFWF